MFHKIVLYIGTWRSGMTTISVWQVVRKKVDKELRRKNQAVLGMPMYAWSSMSKVSLNHELPTCMESMHFLWIKHIVFSLRLCCNHTKILEEVPRLHLCHIKGRLGFPFPQLPQHHNIWNRIYYGGTNNWQIGLPICVHKFEGLWNIRQPLET